MFGTLIQLRVCRPLLLGITVLDLEGSLSAASDIVIFLGIVRGFWICALSFFYKETMRLSMPS